MEKKINNQDLTLELLDIKIHSLIKQTINLGKISIISNGSLSWIMKSLKNMPKVTK